MENRKKTEIYILIGSIGVVILAVVIIIILWSSNGNTNSQQIDNSSNRSEITSYSTVSNYRDKVYDNYRSEVKRLLLPVNVGQLYVKMNTDFLEQNHLNRDNFQAYLENNHLISDNIVLQSYEVYSQGDIELYKIRYFVYEGDFPAYKAVINVIETKPYEYTLSFSEDAEDLLNKTMTRTVNKIDFTIKLLDSQPSGIKYEIAYQNHTGKDIYIDFDDISNVEMILKNDTVIKMASTVISSEEEMLTDGSTMKKEAFFIVNLAQQASIKAIRFNKVKIGDEVTSLTINY